MAVSFTKKGKSGTTAKKKKAEENTAAEEPKKSSTTTGKSESKGNGVKSFLQKGDDAKTLAEEHEARSQELADKRNKLFRFGIPKDELDKDYLITFLDGDLDEDGEFNPPLWEEHTVPKNGGYENVVCTKQVEGSCPICDAGDNPALCGALTVIVHTPYKIKKGKRQGETITDRRQLYVFKTTTLKQLQKQANKRGGLAGCTYEVSRSGPKTARVGDTMEFIEKRTHAQLVEKYGEELCVAADIEEEITYHTPDEIEKLGLVQGGGSYVAGGNGGADMDGEL